MEQLIAKVNVWVAAVVMLWEFSTDCVSESEVGRLCVHVGAYESENE